MRKIEQDRVMGDIYCGNCPYPRIHLDSILDEMSTLATTNLSQIQF